MDAALQRAGAESLADAEISLMGEGSRIRQQVEEQQNDDAEQRVEEQTRERDDNRTEIGADTQLARVYLQRLAPADARALRAHREDDADDDPDGRQLPRRPETQPPAQPRRAIAEQCGDPRLYRAVNRHHEKKRDERLDHQNDVHVSITAAFRV